MNEASVGDVCEVSSDFEACKFWKFDPRYQRKYQRQQMENFKNSVQQT